MSEEEAKREAPIMREAQQMLRRWEAKDPEVYSLWETMNGWVYEGFDKTYEAMASASIRYTTSRDLSARQIGSSRRASPKACSTVATTDRCGAI